MSEAGGESLLSLDPPGEKQRLFFTDTHRYVGFGGARGGGKSWAVRTKAALLALGNPGIRILIVRRTYPELMNNHIREMRRLCGEVAAYNSANKILEFANGSTVNFMYCARDGDLDRLQGVEYDVIFLDEATQLSEFQIRAITACVRGVNEFPKRVYMTMNPGGQGHGYIKRVFIDRRYEPGENPADYSFIRSLVTDNKPLMAVDPEYIRQLEALPKKLRDAWLYGRWDAYEGQFFEELTDDPAHYADRQHTHVIAPFDIPRSWEICRSYDFGYAKPFSCAWWAVDYDGTIYRILELYGCTETANEGVRWTPDRQFKEIARLEREHPLLKGREIRGVADPAIWDASRGESIAETAGKNGVYFTPGDNRRIPGWMQCHYRLAFDEEGYPGMYVFSSCKAFLRTVPLLRYSDTCPEDLDTDGEDHVADEWRYLCMSRPIRPVATEKGKAALFDPLSSSSQVPYHSRVVASSISFASD